MDVSRLVSELRTYEYWIHIMSGSFLMIVDCRIADGNAYTSTRTLDIFNIHGEMGGESSIYCWCQSLIERYYSHQSDYSIKCYVTNCNYSQSIEAAITIFHSNTVFFNVKWRMADHIVKVINEIQSGKTPIRNECTSQLIKNYSFSFPLN